MKTSPYIKVGSRTQNASPVPAASPATEMMRECEKAQSRMNAPQRLRDAWKATQDAEYSRPVAVPATAGSFDESEPETQTRDLRTIGRFASADRTANYRNALAELAAGSLASFPEHTYADALTALYWNVFLRPVPRRILESRNA